MLYLSVKFLHVIAAMVYFGLPFAFGRWYASCLASEDRGPMADALDKMQRFALVHLNGAGLIIIASGIWLGQFLSQTHATWFLTALLLTVGTLVNLNALLVPALSAHRRHLDPARDKSVRRRIALFSALHHTMVTAAAALMIFRPL